MDEDDLIHEARQQADEAIREFREAHKAGMEAFARHDYEAVMESIHAEFKAVEKLKAATGHVARKIPHPD